MHFHKLAVGLNFYKALTEKAIKTICDGVNIGAFQQLFCPARKLIPCLKQMLFCQLIDRIDSICGTARNFGRKTIKSFARWQD